MDAELKLILSLTRKLPGIRGAGVVANWLKRFYLRAGRNWVEADVLGMRMRLDPAECIDGALLFYPQLYDRAEADFLCTHLQHGDTFGDCGANIGFYSLLASQKVGEQGRVLSVEADPYNFGKMLRNLQLNKAENVCALNVGVSDDKESLGLYLNTGGNRGGNSFLTPTAESIVVSCYPFATLLRDCHLGKLTGLKLDIEGFEFRVLCRFFADVTPDLYPGFVIVECNPTLSLQLTGGNPIELLKSKGYRVHRASGLNYIMTLGIPS